MRRFSSTSKEDLIESIRRSIRGKESGLKNKKTSKYTKQDMKKEIKTLKWALEILELTYAFENSTNPHDQLMKRVGQRFPGSSTYI